ncbi:DUF5133 domain-containing protein [Streptomyces sp. NPDC054794]
MLMPHPATLRKLVDEYESLLAEELAAEEPAAGARTTGPRAQDLAYTLCVSTGTREVRLALEAARSQLAASTSVCLPVAEPARK